MNSASQEHVVVAGPSHVRRFAHAIRTGQVAAPRRRIEWRHLASASILHPFLRHAPFARTRQDAVYFVPDFRIGNRSLVDDSGPDAFIGVSKELIDPANDRAIFDRSMEAILQIKDANPHCRFIFWSLAGRELSNRIKGTYGRGDAYRHPTWNLDEVEEAVGDQCVSLRPVLDHPVGRLLHIDASKHPSVFGLEFYRRVVDLPDGDAGRILDEIRANVPRPVLVFPAGTVLTGDSYWLTALRLYLAKGLVRLAPDVEVCGVEEALDRPADGTRRVRYISNLVAGGGDTAIRLEQTRETLRRLARGGHQVRAFLWEARARQVLNPRLRRPGDHPESSRSLESALTSRDTIFATPEPIGAPSYVHARDVEISHREGIMPTMDGILAVVRALGGNFRRELI